MDTSSGGVGKVLGQLCGLVDDANSTLSAARLGMEERTFWMAVDQWFLLMVCEGFSLITCSSVSSGLSLMWTSGLPEKNVYWESKNSYILRSYSAYIAIWGCFIWLNFHEDLWYHRQSASVTHFSSAQRLLSSLDYGCLMSPRTNMRFVYSQKEVIHL